MDYYNYEESASIGSGYLTDYIMVYDFTWQKGTREAKVWAVRAENAEEAAQAVLDEDADVDCEPMGYEEGVLVDGREIDITEDIVAIVSFDGCQVMLMYTDTDPEDIASMTMLDTLYNSAKTYEEDDEDVDAYEEDDEEEI